MTIDRRIAAELRELFGADVGARRSTAAIARALGARSVATNRESAREAAYDLMWD